jgi:tetratricopeptide (TPR) repeat protein
MQFDAKSILNGIKDAIGKGIFTPEKIAQVLPLDSSYVQNFITMVLPAVIGPTPGLIGLWLAYSFLSGCRRKLPEKELKEEFQKFYQIYSSLIQKWDNFITASGIQPLTRIIGNVNRAEAESDKQKFLAGLKPTYNVIIDNLDIKREKYDVIKKQIAEKNILILGTSGSGKTVLMMRLAYDLMQAGWNCFIAQSSIITDKALSFLNQEEFASSNRVVFIDDAARGADNILQFVREIYQQSANVKIVLVEQKSRWQKTVKENLAGYNFVEEEITLTNTEAEAYINSYGGDKKLIPFAKGLLPVLIFLQKKKKTSLEKAIDDFWNPLIDKEKQLMLPILIVSSYYLDYPRAVFEKIYSDNLATIAELEKCNIISRDDTWISTWHPLISQAILKNISLTNQSKLNHLFQLLNNIPPDHKYLNFLFSIGTEILIRAEDEKDKEFIDIGIEFLTQTLKLNPKLAEAYNNRGNAYSDKGDPDPAIADYNKAIELNPKYAEAYYNRGTAYRKKGDPDRAIADYTKAIELNPKYAEAYYNRGTAYTHKKDYDRAIADCNKAIELNPNFAGAYNNRGIAYADKGDPDRAIADYTKGIELNPKFAQAYTNRGNAYYDKGDLDRAIADYTKAIELNPNSAQAYYNRGIAYRKKGDLDRAIADCNKAIELNPNSAQAYYNRGNAYSDKGDLEQAIADYTKAIELNPNSAQAYYNRGNAYYDKGDHDRAIADYTKAIELNPKLAEAYYNRGIAYTNKSDLDRAIADYNKAIELNPKLAQAYNNRGVAYRKKGDYNRAIADCNKAIELNPKFAEAMANLGRVYHKRKGDKNKAEFWYKEALKNKEFLPDKGKRVQQWLKELQEEE